MATQSQSLDFNKIADSCRSISTLSNSFETTINSATSAVGKITGNAWEGEAATNFQSELNGLVGKLPTANQQLAYSVLYLTSVSDGYEALGDSTVNKLIDLVGGQAYIDGLDVSSMSDPDLSLKKVTTTNTDTTQTYTDNPDTTNTDNTNNTNTDNSNNTDSGNNSNNYNNYNDYSNSGSPSYSDTTTTTSLAGQSFEIPATIKQAGYTARGYDAWINTGEEMKWTVGSPQEIIANTWKQQGSNFKNGLAVIKVANQERYVIEVTPKFGTVGDCIDVTLEDGTTIPCIIGESKGDQTGSEWGQPQNDGSVSILEFMVQRSKFLEAGNPTTESWNLEWDSTKNIKVIKNLGNIMTAVNGSTIA